MRNQNRQHGGTILGIIIGLVIGLGIALAVAVVITKTPMPFTNKLARPEKAPTPTPGQRTDPNKPLYGARTPAPEAPPRQLAPMPAAPANTAAQPPRSKAPVIELSPGAAADKWDYYLQAGAFRSRTDADNLRAKLVLSGVEARISERQSENGTLYRVRVGPFGQIEAMNQVRAKLSENGIDAAVVRAAKQQ